MKNMTKKRMIENHLVEKGSITSLEAITEYWHTRLSDVIFKLKKKGWKFETVLMPHKSGSYFAKYILISIPANYYDN